LRADKLAKSTNWVKGRTLEPPLPTISVIIPTLNEEACLAATLESLAHDRPSEVIVVDGGSTDATVDMARPFARLIESPRGRATQQNAGAAAAAGDLLLFLHADCRLAPGWQAAARRAARRPGFVAGAFRMRIGSGDWVYRAIERGGDLRVRWLGLPYGDQGIFLWRRTFERLGGFPVVRLMEDLLFMRRVRQFGRVVLAPHLIHISPRRWQQAGVVRQTVRNWTLTALALLGGVHPNRLAPYYPTVR
jgi:rSAM/selenodomain-associated transferase 2